MDVSASDIENVTFATAKKGYDADQVDRFLDNVAATIRNLEEQLRQVRMRIGELEGQSQESRETEEMMRRTLLVAQRASDEALAEAQARARDMIANAEVQSREMEAQARARSEELAGRMLRQRQAFEADIEALKRFHADFRQALQQMISEHADVLHKTGRLAEQAPDVPSERAGAQPQPDRAPGAPAAPDGGAASTQPVQPPPRPASLAPQPRKPGPDQRGEAQPETQATQGRPAPEPPAPPAPEARPAPGGAPAGGGAAPPPPQVAGASDGPAVRPATAPGVPPEPRRS